MAVTYVLQWQYYDTRPRPAYPEFLDFALQLQASQEDDSLNALAQSIADESQIRAHVGFFSGGNFHLLVYGDLRRWAIACNARTVSFD